MRRQIPRISMHQVRLFLEEGIVVVKVKNIMILKNDLDAHREASTIPDAGKGPPTPTGEISDLDSL